ncbi:hypothetical protein DY048_05250 [Apilactobacillus timberlakei]|uniref:Uncharacterized protein n=1 Tax=Apilactobacillus timberlakei TaxID=2008380 RepID=A0ABY2YTP3_9LACO|nr:hypothetical protein [Apilactobacillus timberlakei]TPR13310.1 hypothetical protein DYZ97_05325 [Apilactobacillus timberlakei]TPR14355.1 hypothetical protein DY048_05250 [Apilactobacillus timberlakei]TPR16608.1 hypothetical protein DY052_03340 [Apilactobacillus timberlakei]
MKNYLKKSLSAKELSNTLITLLGTITIIYFGRNVDGLIDLNIAKLLEIGLVFIILLFMGLFKDIYLNKADKKNGYIIFNFILLFIEIILLFSIIK